MIGFRDEFADSVKSYSESFRDSLLFAVENEGFGIFWKIFPGGCQFEIEDVCDFPQLPEIPDVTVFSQWRQSAS